MIWQTEYAPSERERHLRDILALCVAEGVRSLTEPASLRRALSTPGVYAVVAARDGEVVGFAQIQSDRALQAYLSPITVDERYRRWGIGGRLIQEAFALCGAERVDLISTEDGEVFYESFSHKARSGYGIYPGEG